MSDTAHIDSIDVLREFRVALLKFSEAADSALGDADSDVRRTLTWLENEQSAYWDGQVRKRQDLVTRAAEKLREKRIFKDATGRIPPAVDEEKALRLAKQRLDAAMEKQVLVRKYARMMQKVIQDFKGAIQPLGTHIAYDIPVAVARLDKLAALLQAYTELAPAGASGETSSAAGAAGMSRPVDARPAADDARPADEDQAASDSSQSSAGDDLPDFPAFEAPAVVVVRTHTPTGLVLAADTAAPGDGGNQYRHFPTVESAIEYVRQLGQNEPDIACAIYANDRSTIAMPANATNEPPKDLLAADPLNPHP